MAKNHWKNTIYWRSVVQRPRTIVGAVELVTTDCKSMGCDGAEIGDTLTFFKL
jgi:hypothetical protein